MTGLFSGAHYVRYHFDPGGAWFLELPSHLAH